MTVGLEWLLGQRELGLKLVAGGADGRQPQLTWAHGVDVVDPTPWLAGGELVMTTGLGLGRSVREQRAYVERLADAGIAALGFGVGIRYDNIPAPIVEVCSARQLALVEIPLPTPFIAITQAVASRLAEREIEGMERALAYQGRLTRSAVRGGLAAVANLLSRELHCEVVVLDEYGAAIGSSTKEGPLLELINQEWRQLRSHTRRGTVGIEVEDGVLEFQTLQGRSAIVGWLAVLARETVSPTDRLLLNQAAGLITLQLDWPAELIAAYHALGGTLLDLLLDPVQRASELVHHLGHFGFGPSDPVMLALATAPSRSHARLLAVVNDTLEASARPHVVSHIGAGVAALLIARDTQNLVELLDRAVRDAGISKVVIGVSGSRHQTDVSAGLGPAEQAADAARRDRDPVGWFDDLTLGSVVSDELIRSRLWTLVGSALDGLLHDTNPRQTDLVPSLEAFLRLNGSWEGAARTLGVHRHTLRARMDRVEEITGLSLDVAENRVLLLLALLTRPRD